MDMPIIFRFLSPLLFAAILCLARIWRGSTAPDRAAAFNTLGLVLIGFCGVLSIFLKKGFLMDIMIAWAIQWFIVNIALAKFLEGKYLDR
jgi:multicomponent Na+:H+ antiporter subunit F